MTSKSGFGKCSLLILFHQPMDEKIKLRPLRFPAKENPNMEKTLSCSSMTSDWFN